MLAADGVHVWRVALGERPAGAALLSADERERAVRLRFERDRSAFVAGRAALRTILGGYLGADPAALGFVATEGGKPSVVDGGDLCFSFSRSTPWALVAVTRQRQVGVDIECVRPLTDVAGLVRAFFSPAEAEALAALPDAGRLAGFFAGWTAKEALAKATGSGLAAVGGRGEADPRWSVHPVDVAPGTAAAVAVDGPAGEIVVLATSAAALGEPAVVSSGHPDADC
ncbi:MAG: 4'-phosphopantetheinyl transferase superfamily protein [Acidimicrobiales bacterium]